jgi:hypothetical protein
MKGMNALKVLPIEKGEEFRLRKADGGCSTRQRKTLLSVRRSSLHFGSPREHIIAISYCRHHPEFDSMPPPSHVQKLLTAIPKRFH